MSSIAKPRQVDRVLAALRANPQGLNETRFAAPNVIDGGAPIQRVAARIWDLKQDGHVITVRRERNLTATYMLREASDQGQLLEERAA